MHRKEVTHSNGSYERKSRGRKLADEMGRGKKFPWYTHRLMHRKRVTCELHDSYFRLMTIKTCDSKDRVGNWVDVELLYNSVKTEVRQLEIGRSYRRDVVRKSIPGRRGSGPPIELGSREVADKMQQRKPSSSRELGRWASSWASGERERHNLDGHKSGGQNIAVMFGLQLPLTRKLWITLSNLTIKLEVYIC